MLSSPVFLPSLRLRLLLVGCALAVVSLLYLPLPLLPSLTEQYGQQATRLVSFYGFSYAIGFLVFGPLSDYVGRQRIMVMGLALLSVVTLAMVFVPTFELLLIGRGIQGFIAASFPPVVIAYLAERGSVSDRTWGVALLSTAALLAGVVGQIYGLSVAASGRLTLSLLPLCLIYLITALALSKVPNERAAHSPQDRFFHRYRFITQLLRHRSLRRVYVPAGLLLMSFVAFYILLDLHLHAVLLTYGLSVLMARIIVFPAFFMPLVMVRFAARWSTQRSLATGLGLTVLGLMMAAWANSTHIGFLLFSSFIFVAGIGISIPSLITQIAVVAAPERRGLAIALYTFFLFVGAGLGPVLVHSIINLSLGKSYAVLASLMALSSIYATWGFLIKRH